MSEASNVLYIYKQNTIEKCKMKNVAELLPNFASDALTPRCHMCTIFNEVFKKKQKSLWKSSDVFSVSRTLTSRRDFDVVISSFFANLIYFFICSV
jgi:hypothetical protein